MFNLIIEYVCLGKIEGKRNFKGEIYNLIFKIKDVDLYFLYEFSKNKIIISILLKNKIIEFYT
tara:strand:+ start:1286 stop:1474 length:189 start_codon:yes stop_codon:yes gene_type:complete